MLSTPISCPRSASTKGPDHDGGFNTSLGRVLATRSCTGGVAVLITKLAKVPVRWVRGHVSRAQWLGAHATVDFAEHTPDILDNLILANGAVRPGRFAFRRESVRQMVGGLWTLAS